MKKSISALIALLPGVVACSEIFAVVVGTGPGVVIPAIDNIPN